MIKRFAALITKYSVTHNWIEGSQYAWCQYALEKQLAKTLFFFVCLLLVIFTHTWVEVGAFILVFYLFRSRMGGWHASHVWSCQLVSIALVIMITFIIGPIVKHLGQPTLITVDITIVTITFFVTPLYPVEAHFTQTVRTSNMTRKNVMLLILIILQGISMIALGPSFLAYSLLALLITDLSVLLQYLKTKKEG